MNYKDLGKKPQTCESVALPKENDDLSSGETLAWAGIAALFFFPLAVVLAALSGALYVTEKMEEHR